jgi:hypothetical protein
MSVSPPNDIRWAGRNINNSQDHVFDLQRLASKVVSFTPGFSPVLNMSHWQETVSTVFPGFAMKLLKQFLNNVNVFPPG